MWRTIDRAIAVARAIFAPFAPHSRRRPGPPQIAEEVARARLSGFQPVLFRGLLRGVLLARPKVTTQGCRRVARSAAGLVRANPPTGHHLPSRPSPLAICDLPPAGCCSASHQLAHLRIPWSNSWWQGMPRQHNQMQPQRQPPAGPSAHSPVQFLVPRPAGPHNQRQPRRPPACSPDRTN